MTFCSLFVMLYLEKNAHISAECQEESEHYVDIYLANLLTIRTVCVKVFIFIVSLNHHSLPCPPPFPFLPETEMKIKSQRRDIFSLRFSGPCVVLAQRAAVLPEKEQKNFHIF